MATTKDDTERQQQAGALATGNSLVAQAPKGVAHTNAPANAARLAKVPPGIGGNPGSNALASATDEKANVAPPAGAPAAPPSSPAPMATVHRQPAIAETQPVAPATPDPLAAQAQSDRAKIGAAWDTVKDVSGDAGRAALDIATMVPRGIAGAIDSAVIRPMRAAGVDTGYISPKLVPVGVDPSSMTPFTDQKRMLQGQAEQPSANPPGKMPLPEGVNPSGVGGGRGPINPPMADPNKPPPTMTPEVSGPAAGNPMTNWDRTGMTNAQVAQANPAGRVTMQRQPNGTMSFSGGDVSGPVSYTNSAGNPLVGSGIRGTGFSRVDSAQAGTAVGMDGAGNYAFTSGNPIAGAAGDSRSPVGMPVEQAQREGLVGQRVGYNPAFDQRLNGGQGQASMSATTSSGVDAALAAAAGRGDFDAVRAHYAGRGQETSAQAIAQQPQAGFTGSIGQPIDNGGAWGRTPEQQRKDAETQASSIHKQTAERGAAALKSLDGREAVNAKAQAEMQQELLRQSGALQREGMRNQSEDFRTASQNRLAAAELAQRYRDSDAQNEIRNLEAANARRTAGIKERFDNATSEAERMSIIRQYPDVFGQKSVQGKDRYMTVGGGTSVVDGQTVREPTMVFDTVTQQYVGGGAPGGGQAGQQAKAPEYEKGQVYVDPQSGSQRRWNGTGWERV